MLLNKISFVYFDVGGVAIKDFSDSPKWENMIHDLGLDKFDKAKVDLVYNQRDTDLCLGKIHADELVVIYNRQYPVDLDPSFSLLNYFIDHFELNPGIWPIVQKVQQSKKTGLLTDMYLGMLDGIFARQLIPNTSWDSIVDSSVEGVRMPMPEIYALAQERAGVSPGEILFIDNRQKNLDGAVLAGWQTYRYDSSDYDQANLDLAKFLGL